MSFEHSGVGLGLLAAVAAVAPAGAQTIDARNPKGAVDALVSAGQQARLEAGKATGDPVIIATNQNFDYSIHFTGCMAKVACTGIELYSSFTPPKRMTLVQIADWNAKSSFGRAGFASNGDPNLTQPLVLTNGSLGRQPFIDNTNRFREAMVSMIRVALAE